MSLEQYKRPSAVTFSVEGEKFVVDLPTRWHKAYMRHWQDKISEHTSIDSDGKVSIGVKNPSFLIDARIRAFVECCIIETPLSIEDLLGDYLPLAEALYNAADELTDIEEARADALVGKLSLGSSGKGAGKAKLNSTTSLSQKAELQPTM